MLSLFLSYVYERGHVNALSDNTRNILYYLDAELTKILHLNVASQVAPHMCVFQTYRWNVNSVPFILTRRTRRSNSHIFECVCHIVPNKIAEALIVLWFVTLPSILQELVTRKPIIHAKFHNLICQVCFFTFHWHSPHHLMVYYNLTSYQMMTMMKWMKYSGTHLPIYVRMNNQINVFVSANQ